MVLSINEISNDRLKGVFEFRSGGSLAKYNVTGTATPSGTFELEPGAWTLQPPRFRATALRGEIVEMGGRKAIRGTLTQCKTGSFLAFLQKPIEPPPPPLSKGMFDAKGPAWIDAVRGRIREFVEKREDNQHWWNMLENEVIFSRVDRPTRDQLLAEVREARANLGADSLLADLASGPREFPQGIGRALIIFRQAQKSEWPNKIKLRVYQACQKRVGEVLRPLLTQAAASAAGLPTSLDGLIRARAMLAPLEEYRGSLEQAFGTLDQENLLTPLWQRIAALESNPAVAVEFRAALEKARQQPDPRSATENVIFSVLGQQEFASPLTAIAKEGRRLAALTEVEVANNAQNEDGSEPGANDIAAYMHGLTETINATFAAMRCAPGKYDFDPITIARCKMGELEVRLKRVVKIACRAEKPRQQYLCQFDHRSQLVSFRTGQPVPLEESLSLQAYFPGGRLAGSSRARFVPNVLGSGWTGSRVGDQE
ncbi:hypothetical protein [Neorhizobium sp. LjRoot104]|uniref:hypothetical protein n=1 Tax=Neorhizobium sp. LjRoot104 TaxID=3342254 RepID=UPI003ECF1050